MADDEFRDILDALGILPTDPAFIAAQLNAERLNARAGASATVRPVRGPAGEWHYEIATLSFWWSRPQTAQVFASVAECEDELGRMCKRQAWRNFFMGVVKIPLLLIGCILVLGSLLYDALEFTWAYVALALIFVCGTSYVVITRSKVARLMWADRCALGVALLILVVAGVISILAFIRARPDDVLSLSSETVIWTGKAELVAALPLWAVLRIVDFMLGGPRRRAEKSQ
jgi:hypothetical protein